MAKYQFERKLRQRAEEFINTLRAAGIEAIIVEDSLREYALKVSCSRNDKALGTVVLYYSPKVDSFSLKTDELKDKSIDPILQECWSGRSGLKNKSSSIYEIYVDGSFINHATGYGAVILKDGNVVDELFGAVDVSEVNGTRQVAGELIAVKEALKWCHKHSINEVSIFYDYLGIEKWATAEWKTNQPLTREYARFVRECPIRIRWHKVASHTGNRWNDRADALAKKGAGSLQSADVETELVAELVKTTDAWIEFLMVRGIEARFDRVYNEQFARVYILIEESIVGTFDLYNTRKKRLSPYLHNFRDDNLKSRIETLSREFLVSGTVS